MLDYPNQKYEINIRRMPAKKTPKDYRKLAAKVGFVWLGPEVNNTQTKTRWRCKNGHEWDCLYSSIQQGHGCPYCANALPKKPSDYHELANKHDFMWLGPEVKNVSTKTRWRCKNGHEWESIYANIQQGYGCPYCGRSHKKEPSDYESLAKSKGFEWLGPIVSNSKAKTNWRCKNGHIWNAPYSSVQQGNQCYFCLKNTSKHENDYYALALTRGFKWLGPNVSNAQVKTFWKCSNGHVWQATYSKIKYGKGCPYCYGNVLKNKDDYKKLAAKRGFKWLGRDVINTHTKTLWQCSKKHTWAASYHSIDTGSTGCPHCAGNLPKKAIDYKKLAKQCELKWLGPEVLNVMTKTWWECPNGHKWQSSYSMVNSGYGCPKCLDMVNSKLVSNPQRSIAKMIGGKLNLQEGKYTVDVAMQRNEQLIAIEYDAWYWHGDRQKQDAVRDEALNTLGWRVIRIKSGKHLPQPQQLEEAISELLNGKWYCEIVLDDWGKGPTTTKKRKDGKQK